MAEDEGSALDRFFASLREAPSRVLLLDYDGTLAPFRVERDRAVPYDGVRKAVRGVLGAGDTRLVVISGRTLSDLRPLLGVEPPPELWGTHGWERRRPGEPAWKRELDPALSEALSSARDALADQAPADRVETKPASVAVHVRGLSEADAEALLGLAGELWKPLASGQGLELHAFDGGLELRVPGWNKGDAVRAVLAEEPTGTAVAYLGDDLTDEDAFAALNDLEATGRVRGLGVLVREHRRASRATVWLRPPEELLAFLDRWREATR